MTNDKTKVLIEKYPKIFDNNFYFEHGDGWNDIIDRACAIMQNHIDAREKYVQYKKSKNEETDIEEVIQVVALQSKEKFGGLRFYISGGDEFCRGVVSMTENMSMFICESCSEKGQLRDDMSWMQTLCDKHYEESTRRKM
jgi:hypothetical protein